MFLDFWLDSPVESAMREYLGQFLYKIESMLRNLIKLQGRKNQ